MSGARLEVKCGAIVASILALGLGWAATCGAADRAAVGDDASALDLADSTAHVTQKRRNWRAFVETAVGTTQWRPTGGGGNGNGAASQRLSAGFAIDTRLADGVRVIVDDRLDVGWSDPAGRLSVNTLKDAYVSWRIDDENALDVGRIKTRQGVATGYNPTDYFKAGALRTIISNDPNSLRENRMGTGMVRAQRLWNQGSLTAMLAPKLSSQTSTAPFNADLGATNGRTQWLIVGSQRLSKSIDPQWLVSGGAGRSPQFGFNLSGLVDDATVAYVEYSGGRSQTQLSQALGPGAMAPDGTLAGGGTGTGTGSGGRQWHNRLATGLTHTFANKLSVTGEYQYDSAALNAAAWRSLASTPIDYGRYRAWVQTQQELPTRHAALISATLQDAGVQHLDVTALLRADLVDRSRMVWLEGRYHFDRAELALQWQTMLGRNGSDYGAAPQRRVVQLILRYFL